VSATPDEQTQEQDGPEPDEQPTPIQPPDEDEQGEAGEGEQVEGVPAEPQEGEQPSAAAGAVGEKEIEKMFKRVETANAAYARKVGEILGEEAQVLEPCPRCAAPFLGLIWPPDMKPASAEVRDAVLVSVGEQPAQATMQTKYARRCDACDGNGVVLTGSRTNRDKAINCPECKGRGWMPVGDELRVGRSDIAPATAPNGQTEVTAETLAPTAPAPDVDLWGRRVGDPDYGMHPNYVASR